MGKIRIKKIDPFYKGPRDKETGNDAPGYSFGREQRKSARERRNAAVAAAAARQKEDLEETEITGTRSERAKEHILRKSKKVRVKAAPVSTGKAALDGWEATMAGEGEADIARLVNMHTVALASEGQLHGQVAIQEELAKPKRSRKQLKRLGQTLVDRPHELVEHEGEAKFVDADALAKKALLASSVQRQPGEGYFQYAERVKQAADAIQDGVRVDQKTGQQAASKAERKRTARKEKKEERRKKQRLAKRQEVLDDDRIEMERVEFGDVVQEPPKLPKLPERLLKRKEKHQQSIFGGVASARVPTSGLPAIEDAAGGLAATRRAIIGQKNSVGLVGARSLSVEEYAKQVRQAYKTVKAKRREGSGR